MNWQELKNILSQKFDFEVWKPLLQQMFKQVDFFTQPVSIDASLIKSGGQQGVIHLADKRDLALFVFEVTDSVKIDRNRKGLREIGMKYVDQTIVHGALVFFYSAQVKDYRLTFVSKETSFDDNGNLVKKETAPKRYTFLLGENEPCTTAAERLMKFFKIDSAPSMEDLEEAFSVERLNKEFFSGYKEQYFKLCKYIKDYYGNKIPDEKKHRDYVKKLLGRLVFLHFLQKRGWLGVSAEECGWHGGNRQYLQNLTKKYSENDRLLSDILEFLFFETLNKKRDNDIADSRLGCNVKIPYLNGGLFDKDEIDKLDIDFPYSYFSDLMSFFSMYNFTIDENDPDDAEIGIDPEMLGHIFENLLEDNKDKGAFYTPKEIVDYMCKASVCQYLKTCEPDSALEKDIQTLVFEGYVPPAISHKKVAERFVSHLNAIKICDPAIGSGAFPMGILKVLFSTLHYLQPHADPYGSFDASKTKRDIIRNNIFGVDIEQGAVDIARLRFWLSLVIEEEEPTPLPNLDFKIVCGNSQLYRYPITMPIETVFMDYNKYLAEKAKREKQKMEKFTLKKYKELVAQYTDEHTQKQEKKNEISEIKKCFKVSLAKCDILKRQAAEYVVNDYEAVDLFGNRKADADPMGYREAKAQLQKLRTQEEAVLNNQKYKNSFEWRFEYPQLLDENGDFVGFDIIIANPPYLKEGRISKSIFEPYKTSPYYMGKMDLWYLFACNSLDLLNDKGVLCYIATNNWVTSFGAKILRNKVMKETRICSLIDFGSVMVFESASIQTMIMMFQKDTVSDDYLFDYRKLLMDNPTEKNAKEILFNRPTESVCFTPRVRRQLFLDKSFTFSENDAILQAIQNKSGAIFLKKDELTNGIHPHFDFVNKKQSLKHGIPQGSGIFGLSSSELSSMSLSPEERALIKPYYNSSENIGRFSLLPTRLHIIYTPSQFKNPSSMDSYPTIKSHLDKYSDIITSDNKPYGLHRSREEHFFLEEKVIALRKCAGKPVFVYSDGETYMSALFYIIQTNRVNLKYLTGLLNSKLIEFWLRNKGKMQGANFQLDKEPLQQIPIAVPSKQIQELVAHFVDCIISLKTNSGRLNNLVSNDYIADAYEKLINGCVFEVYFEDELKNLGESFISPLIDLYNQHQCDIWALYNEANSKGIIERVDALPYTSSEVFKTIILS